mmetsp:Transcript_50402/g.109459  ORF Transcript_50402/g.109459 Transcript_50402/m.109459 type:complete len:207 (+) Transcript_50402:7-627(+)
MSAGSAAQVSTVVPPASRLESLNPAETQRRPRIVVRSRRLRRPTSAPALSLAASSTPRSLSCACLRRGRPPLPPRHRRSPEILKPQRRRARRGPTRTPRSCIHTAPEGAHEVHAHDTHESTTWTRPAKPIPATRHSAVRYHTHSAPMSTKSMPTPATIATNSPSNTPALQLTHIGQLEELDAPVLDNGLLHLAMRGMARNMGLQCN